MSIKTGYNPLPVYPGVQIQLNRFTALMHVAPLKQGCDKHSSISNSQWSPVYPGVQKHW